MANQFEAGQSSSPLIKAVQCNPAWRAGSQKPAMCQGQVLISLLGPYKQTKLHNCRTQAEDLHQSKRGSPN